jgi:tetratricopeptide (TPR) repeat protein
VDEQRFRKAIAARDAGRYEKAFVELSAMLDTATDREEQVALLLNMGNCKAATGEFEDAVLLLGRARQLLLPNDTAPSLHADFLAAMICAARREYPEAAQKFRAILSTYSELLSTPEEMELLDDAKERLAFALVGAQKFSEALPLLQSLMDRHVGEGQRVHLYLGIAYSFLAENDKARAEFDAASVGPDSSLASEALCRLGILEFQSRRFATARGYLERAAHEPSLQAEWKIAALDYLSRLSPDEKAKSM